jgi:hypothetical protein
MIKINSRQLHGRQYFLYSFRLLCLLCTLVSFCFLFAYSEAGFNLSQSGGTEYTINSYSNPVLLQLNCRFSPISLMEGIRNKKTSFIALASIHSGISSHAPGENAFFHMLLGPNNSFRVNFKFTYLLLDLPPPSL